MFVISEKRAALDAISILRDELKQAHDILEQAVAGLTLEQLHHRADGATICSIATIYAHAVMTEDYLMNGQVLRRAPLFARECWAPKVGIEMTPFGGDYAAWLETLPAVDFAALRHYADRVYADSDCCLAGLSEDDLDRTVTFVDEMPLGSFVAQVIAWHAVHHGGEVCALKGVLGGKGLPF